MSFPGFNRVRKAGAVDVDRLRASVVNFFAPAAFIVACLPAFAQEAIRLESVQQIDRRIPIAVPPFAAPDHADLGLEMARIVEYDLLFTGQVRLLPREAYPPGFNGFDEEDGWQDFAAWRQTGIEYLAYAKVLTQDGSLIAECRLFDVSSAREVTGKRLVGKNAWMRLIAHKFADEIVRTLTGVSGIASSELCFSAGATRKKEIYIADYDGSNAVRVTNHGAISICPEFSPDGTKIAHLSYKDGFPFLYIYHRKTGRSTPFSKKVGLNAAPAWSPDGRQLAYVLSKDGNMELYIKDEDAENGRRLTRNRCADTSPTFSPDGKRIAFVSDRLGAPQVFAMDVDGSNQQRLSHQGGRTYDPAWSPDGKYIACAVEKAGEGIEIYVMDADGRNPRRLTDSRGENESPSWSPDSRHLVFRSTRSGGPELWTVTLETGEQRRVPLPGLHAEGPSWGPRQ